VRVLHLADRLTDRGGAYVHLLGVLESLTERGHEVRLAVGSVDGALESPCSVRLLPGLDARGRAAVDLQSVVADFQPDLLHLHTVVNPAALEAAARGPALITVQDHRYFCPSRGKWTASGERCVQPMEPGSCRGCFDDPAYFEQILDLTRARLHALQRLHVIVLSAYMKAELTAVGVRDERIQVIPPFVHGLDATAEPDGPPCVLFVGRLVEAKGALEAWEAWRRSGLELPLLFAGAGPLRAALEEKGARVLGWRGRAELSRLMRRARALIVPSRWQEPFGIAGLEARSLGVPVVAWTSGGVAEWCEPQFLVPWGDIDGLAVALRRASEGPQPAPLAAFGRDALMDRLEAAYRRVLDRSRAAPANAPSSAHSRGAEPEGPTTA
jgi:glycosyltransferase involved in cell wall biosynthesis